jgi:hypothetical protein
VTKVAQQQMMRGRCQVRITCMPPTNKRAHYMLLAPIIEVHEMHDALWLNPIITSVIR